MTNIKCASCGARLKSKHDFSGKTISCPKCDARIEIPFVEVDVAPDEPNPAIRDPLSLINAAPPSPKEAAPSASTSFRNSISRLKIGEKWFQRLRFTVGVLAVWAGFSFLKGLAIEIFSHVDRTASQLKEDQICKVFDFGQEGSPWAPTKCYVYDLEYQRSPQNKDVEDHTDTGYVDLGTLVAVDGDYADPLMFKLKKDGPEFDERPIFVRYLTGPLSGRKGVIARYKIQPVRLMNQD